MSRLKKIITQVLEIPAEKITDKTSPDNTPSWDSFNGLMLVSELEKAFGVSFTMAEVVAVKRVADIKKYLKKHGVKTDEI